MVAIQGHRNRRLKIEIQVVPKVSQTIILEKIYVRLLQKILKTENLGGPQETKDAWNLKNYNLCTQKAAMRERYPQRCNMSYLSKEMERNSAGYWEYIADRSDRIQKCEHETQQSISVPIANEIRAKNEVFEDIE